MQQPMQQQQPANPANDLWGAIADMNQTSAQEQQAQKQKEQEAAQAAAAEKKKAEKKDFSDPFASLVSDIDGVQASDQPPPPQQPAVQQNNAFGGLGNMGGGAQNNPYMNGQPRSSFGGANPMMGGNPMMGSNMSTMSGYGQPQGNPMQAQGNPYMQQAQMGGNPYMAQQSAAQVQNQYMQRQQSTQSAFGSGGNPYMTRQASQQQQANVNPYMQPQVQAQGNPYAAQPAAQGNPYMSGGGVAAQGG